MNKNTKTILAVVLFIAILLVAVAYATLTAVNLNINGKAQAESAQANFTVEFTGTPTKGGDVQPTDASISASDATKATMNVSGLTAKGQKSVATYTVHNTSDDLSAVLTAETTNSNPTYFSVTKKIADPTTLVAGGATTVEVTVELLKTPVDETPDQLSATIGVILTATPQQP